MSLESNTKSKAENTTKEPVRSSYMSDTLVDKNEEGMGLRSSQSAYLGPPNTIGTKASEIIERV